MSVVNLSIREFAVPAPRRGSIEALSGYGRATREGQAIHQGVQARRLKLDPNYQAEVTIAAEFERDGFTFAIGGRVDGFWEGKPARIEEIKSSFSTEELERKLRLEKDHPYNLQLQSYGYFHYLKHGVAPK